MRTSKRNRDDESGRPRGRTGERARELAGALREGGRETRGHLEGRPAQLLSGLLAAIAAGASIALEMLRGLARLVVGIAGGPLARVGERTGALLTRLSRALSPTRVIAAVAVGCAVLLAISQFADFRGVAVGSDNYAGVESVAPAPEVDRAETGSAHSYLFVPAAALAIAILCLAFRAGRWRLCRIAALVGVAAIVVAVVVDRPIGLDEGEAAQQFAGVEAKLLGGFWMQIFAGAGLALTSLLLGSELRRQPRRQPRGARRRSPLDGLGGEPAPLAGGPAPRGART